MRYIGLKIKKTAGYLLILLICFHNFSFSQVYNNKESDSLNTILHQYRIKGIGKATVSDTAFLRNINFLLKSLYFSSFNKEAKRLSLHILKTTDSIYHKAKTIDLQFYNKSMSYTYKGLSNIMQDEGDLDSAIFCLNKTIELVPEHVDYVNSAKSYNSMATIYFDLGKNAVAIQYALRSLKISEAHQDTFGMASSNQKISNFYCYQSKWNEALPYAVRAVEFRRKTGDNFQLILDYNNLANIYGELERNKECIDLLNTALNLAKKIKSLPGEAVTLNNISYYYMEIGENSKALPFAKQGLEIRRKIEDYEGILKSLQAIGTAYSGLKDYENGIKTLEETKEMALKMNHVLYLKDCYEQLSEVNYLAGNYKTAYDYLQEYNTLNDSLLNESVHKQITEMQTVYETEKKEEQNKSLLIKNQLALNTIEKQKITTYFIIGGLVLALLFAFFIFRGLKQQRKANKIISEQKTEVELQKHIVEEKQKEILDSIRYAKRIQQSLLPTKTYINKSLGKLKDKV